MSLVCASIRQSMTGGAWIRKMFEAGIQLKSRYGDEAVCDFSLGNPDLVPPAGVSSALLKMAEIAKEPFGLGYMPNAGFAWARETLAEYLSKEQGVRLTAADVVLSCGASGALNAVFHSVLEPGEKVLSFRPCFVEYGSYVRNHGGVFDTVPTLEGTFAPDLDALEAAVTKDVRAVILNSPNNPTGAVYTRGQMAGVVDVLSRKSEEYGRPVFLVADEPYRSIVYDDVEVPSVLPMYRYAVLVSSFSKNMSIPGERVGYIALSPLMEGRQELITALIASNRALGYVNPPVVGQYIMRDAIGTTVDVGVYRRRRDLMADVLRDAGYEFELPRGTFYFFPKAPGGDDVAFVGGRLLEQKVLAVPGSGFYGPGHFRLAFCVPDEVIERSAEKFKAARGE